MSTQKIKKFIKMFTGTSRMCPGQFGTIVRVISGTGNTQVSGDFTGTIVRVII